jgi:hypothetical protein
MFEVNALSKEIFEANKAVGWWDDMNRCIITTIQLISTEVAEATEGERKDLMDDHLPHRKQGEVELADALIRTLDLGGRFGLLVDLRDLARRRNTIVQSFANVGSAPAVCHFWINSAIVDFGVSYHAVGLSSEFTDHYMQLIATIIAAAQHLGYDLEGAVREKLAYNKQREDHKRENRAAENGKKF